jgi:hypothetical protein
MQYSIGDKFRGPICEDDYYYEIIDYISFNDEYQFQIYSIDREVSGNGIYYNSQELDTNLHLKGWVKVRQFPWDKPEVNYE